jgi:hypothetical protein
MLFPGDNLHELNATGCHATEKKLGRRQCFTRTTILDGSIYHEMMVTGAT